jgi:hypothetical protein
MKLIADEVADANGRQVRRAQASLLAQRKMIVALVEGLVSVRRPWIRQSHHRRASGVVAGIRRVRRNERATTSLRKMHE